ncbi:Protein of unknown function [Syntrophus gentianae]|uniref:DUF1003 domain-containing protein n=1 Tax=Syntrophus gentianae TaxID=43775 RepID=A0A1H8BA80_9BACT|nr:DUF1003 domain-containing protein [Syntrophus gentianae]SEM79871.1 Protein of unknown function [Syntrophus gentianae]
MSSLRFPEPYQHRHPPVCNINELLEEKSTLSQKAADLIARTVGSWRFLIVQSILLAGWFLINLVAWFSPWDPYPFIFMNLILSLQSAYTASIVMISENRQAERDRIEAHNYYDLNVKEEEELRAILDHLAAQDEALKEIHRQLAAIRNDRGPSAGPGDLH